MHILETDRLYLCKLSIEDAPFILTLLNTPSWLLFIGDKKVKSLEDAKKYLLDGPIKSYSQFGFGLYLIKLKINKTPIGVCGLLKREMLESPDIGYALLPQYEGYGYAFEATTAVLDFATTNLKLKRVLAITVPENRRSIRLLEKLKLNFENQIILSKDELMLFARDLN